MPNPEDVVNSYVNEHTYQLLSAKYFLQKYIYLIEKDDCKT